MISGGLYGNLDLTIVNFTLLEMNKAAAWAQDIERVFRNPWELNEQFGG